MNSPSDPEKSIRPVWVRIFYDLTHTSSLSRFLFFCFCDVLIATLSLYLSFLVHFDFNFQVPYAELLREVLLFFVVLKIGFLVIFRIYKITWRYVGVADLMNIVLAVVVAQMALLILSLPNAFFQLPITGLPKRIFLMDGFFTLAFISGLRISKKLYLEVIREKGTGRKGKRTLIIGAGNTGEMLLRDMARNGFADFYPIGTKGDRAPINLLPVSPGKNRDSAPFSLREKRAQSLIFPSVFPFGIRKRGSRFIFIDIRASCMYIVHTMI